MLDENVRGMMSNSNQMKIGVLITIKEEISAITLSSSLQWVTKIFFSYILLKVFGITGSQVGVSDAVFQFGYFEFLMMLLRRISYSSKPHL